MFNGTQKIAFFKKLERSLGTEDLFFLSIRYLLEENNQRQWLDKLYQYPYQYLEEIPKPESFGTVVSEYEKDPGKVR